VEFQGPPFPGQQQFVSLQAATISESFAHPFAWSREAEKVLQRG
jgi:hypothetical protein